MSKLVAHQPALLVTSRAPASGTLPREALDAALAFAVFDVPLKVLFCGEGVWQLLAAQGPAANTGKTVAESWKAAPLYDIEGLYVEQTSLDERGINRSQIIDIAIPADQTCVRQLLAECELVLSF